MYRTNFFSYDNIWPSSASYGTFLNWYWNSEMHLLFDLILWLFQLHNRVCTQNSWINTGFRAPLLTPFNMGCASYFGFSSVFARILVPESFWKQKLAARNFAKISNKKSNGSIASNEICKYQIQRIKNTKEFSMWYQLFALFLSKNYSETLTIQWERTQKIISLRIAIGKSSKNYDADQIHGHWGEEFIAIVKISLLVIFSHQCKLHCVD